MSEDLIPSGKPIDLGPSPLAKAVEIARDMNRLQEASHASYLCMTKATFESLKNHPDMLSDEAQKLYQGFPVQVFESEFECVLFMRMKHAADGSKGMLVKGPDVTPKLPFTLGKSKITIAKPVDEHQRFDCFPMRIEDGKLICCIQNKSSGWWEDWNLEHTLSGVKSGFYRIEETAERQVD